MLNVTKISAVVLIAAAIALGIYAWTLGRRAPPAASVVPAAKPAFPVVVASRRLPAGQPIAADALRIERLSAYPSGAFAAPTLVAKRVPLADIEPGTPVFEGQLSSGFAEQVEPGERAVAVRVDEASAVGDRVRPGNFVDVFLTLKRDGAGIGSHGEIARSRALRLLSRVRVLAFGDASPAGNSAGGHAVHARTVVLGVPADEVDRLALADSAGHLLLALRNPRDLRDVDHAESLPPGPVDRISGSVAHAVGDPARPSTITDAGISLGVLSGSEGGGQAAARNAEAPRTHGAATGTGRVEVVRAGHVDTPGS